MANDPFGFSKAVGQQDHGNAPKMDDAGDRFIRVYSLLCEEDASERCLKVAVDLWNGLNPSNPVVAENVTRIEVQS